MIEFKLIRLLKNEPYSAYKKCSQVTVQELKRMYGIYQKYNANTRYEIFDRDFLENPAFSLFLNLKTNKVKFRKNGKQKIYKNRSSRSCGIRKNSIIGTLKQKIIRDL